MRRIEQTETRTLEVGARMFSGGQIFTETGESRGSVHRSPPHNMSFEFPCWRFSGVGPANLFNYELLVSFAISMCGSSQLVKISEPTPRTRKAGSSYPRLVGSIVFILGRVKQKVSGGGIGHGCELLIDFPLF